MHTTGRKLKFAGNLKNMYLALDKYNVQFIVGKGIVDDGDIMTVNGRDDAKKVQYVQEVVTLQKK